VKAKNGIGRYVVILVVLSGGSGRDGRIVGDCLNVNGISYQIAQEEPPHEKICDIKHIVGICNSVIQSVPSKQRSTTVYTQGIRILGWNDRDWLITVKADVFWALFVILVPSANCDTLSSDVRLSGLLHYSLD
jgi:hypothetical protein